MKQIVPANGNNKVLYYDCKTDGCKGKHTTTWHEVIIAYLILTDEDVPEESDGGNVYVRPITTLDAMQHVQSYGGAHCHIVNFDGVDETEMTDIHS